MKKFKLCTTIFLALNLSVSSILNVGAMVSDDESDLKACSTATKTKIGIPQDLPEISTSASCALSTSQSTSDFAPLSKKKRILRDYPPDLSNLQEIGFGVKIKTTDGIEIEQRVHPDVHFRGIDGKEYLVFYNTGIPKLRDALIGRLKKEVDEQSWVSWWSKSKILSNAQRCTDSHDTSVYSGWNHFLMANLTPGLLIIEPLRIVSTLATPEHSKQLSTVCANLNSMQKTFGDKLIPERLCAVVLDRNLQEFASLRSTPDQRYKEVEEGFYCIANSDMSDRDMVIAMDACMDKFERRIHPRASAEQTIDFCFTLNRASYYLSMLERDIQNKDLPTLEVMDRFRRKINRLMLEYRFIYERNASPILGVRIDRCKIIVETESTTMIFLDREETRKFKRALDAALDNKATNITRRYSMDSFTGPELRRLAESLNPDSCQDVLDQMDHQLVDMKTEAEKSEAEAIAELTKVGLSLAKQGAKVAVNLLSRGEPTALGQTSSAATVPRSETKVKPQFTQQQIEEFLAVEKRLKDEEQVEEVDPLHRVLSGSFDNPRNITIDHPPVDPSPAPEMRVDTTGFDRRPVAVRTRRENITPLGKALKELHISPEDMDNVLKGFECFIESKRVKNHIGIFQKRRDQLAAHQRYMTEFINMVKLYVRLVRGNFESREDFEGVLIEEIRRFETEGGSELLREYIVREINRLEDL